MKRILPVLFICFLSVLNVRGQEPPTREWCEWAFRQIPDHGDLSDVDGRAFSVDFYTLLSVAYTIEKWEREKNPAEIGEWEFLAYWYAGNGDSPLDDPNHSIQYKAGNVLDGKVKVDIIIHTPSWPPYGPEYHRFTMNLVYENRAWRIDDWFNWDFENQGFNGSMKKDLKGYIRWFEKQFPDDR